MDDQQRRPRFLEKAVDLLETDPEWAWSVGDLALACGVARRTLQRYFRRFHRKTPTEYLADVRFDRVRRELLRGSRDATLTEIATRCGFAHLGRFAMRYRQRYGETPSATLRRSREASEVRASWMPLPSTRFERPVVAVLPFELIGDEARRAAAMAEEIAAALLRVRWIAVSTDMTCRYRLRGKVHGDGKGQLRVTVTLADVSIGRIIFADHWDGRGDEAFEFEERVAMRAARAIEPALRNAEIERALRRDPGRLGAWELAMRALPGVLSYEAASEARALELLERAMELAPQDPLPASLAAWCRGVRGCLNFTPRPLEEKEAARRLAARAASLNKGDALTETSLAAGYTLAHDLPAAAVHAERALSLDGGSAWAWGRSGWVYAFSDEGEKAIERFRIARAIAPADPLSAMCCFGIAAPLMQADRHGEAIPWIKRGIAECPRTALWMNPFLAAAYALDHRTAEARRHLAAWKRVAPEATIAQIRSGLPFGPALFDRVAEGLESAGMRDPR
jgi:AraC-like DNA-binding protein/tetratricopeptide (TPR) repeat protein